MTSSMYSNIYVHIYIHHIYIFSSICVYIPYLNERNKNNIKYTQSSLEKYSKIKWACIKHLSCQILCYFYNKYCKV